MITIILILHIIAITNDNTHVNPRPQAAKAEGGQRLFNMIDLLAAGTSAH